MNHEYWCDLLSTIEVKDKRKRAATDIKKIGYARAYSLSNSNGSFRIPRKNKARTGFLQLNKRLHNKAHNHHGNQILCVIYKKSGMPERNYMLHSAEECFVNCTNQKNIKDVLGEPMGIRDEGVKQYKKSESKWKKYLKALKKQKKIISSISNNSGSRLELNIINKIREKASKKRCDYSSDSSSDELDYNSSLCRDID